MNKENMRIWEALGKTDPAHTKQFTRAGGFKGTAIKPMWANKQMTEFFGPCGIGWGMTEPVYQVIPASDEIMVFCTSGIWYVQSGVKHGPVYGVGGDKILVKQQSGLRTDDEAFKKAYTDALSNAMKFIGVAADVHMGLFDDSKYVQEVRAEFEAAEKEAVIAEVEKQKKNPSKVEELTPATRLKAELTGSLTPEERAAAARTAMAEQQGIFSLDNDVLTCKIIGIQTKQSRATPDKPAREFRSVTFNGRLPNGANFASCFDTELWDSIEACLDHECQVKVDIWGKFANITDVLATSLKQPSVEGTLGFN